jgi:phenylacetate-CoA ligase
MHVGNLVDLAQLLVMPWRGAAALRRTQERKLRRIVRHAAANVPFYREIFRSARLDPREIRTLEDITAIPLVSKQDLQALPLRDRVARTVDIRACRTQTTSGSTGVPLDVVFRRRDETILNLGWVRAFLSAGLRPWEKRAVFTPKKELPLRGSWYEYLGLLRRKDISTWRPAEEWLEEVTSWRPDALMGYVKVLRLFAEEVRRSERTALAPRLVFTTSEILDDDSRRLLTEVFGSPVVDIYASAEAGCMAWQCPRCSAFHVSADTVVLELLVDGRQAAPGSAGEVVVTNLHSYAMPFIRYRQGDIAIQSARRPACGRNLPLIEGLEGRQDDCIVLRSGRTISYSPFYYSVQSVPGVRRWRIVQEDLDALLVEIEAGTEFGDESRDRIERNLRGVVADEMEIRIVVVEAIDTDPRVKSRAVSSKVRRH